MKNKKDGLNTAKMKVVVASMPPLAHWVGKLEGEPFDMKKSEAVKWLVQQTEVLQFLWDKIQRIGMIEYDAETNEWMGVDYRSPGVGGGEVTGEVPGVAGVAAPAAAAVEA